VVSADLVVFAEQHGAELPAALAMFYRAAGVGTLGGFLHFVAPQYMSSHAELIGHLLDEDDQPRIEPTADVVVFAQSDNGDMCGWHAAALAAADAPVVRLTGFDETPLAASTSQFLEAVLDADHFGTGSLPATYQRHDWLPRTT